MSVQVLSPKVGFALPGAEDVRARAADWSYRLSVFTVLTYVAALAVEVVRTLSV